MKVLVTGGTGFIGSHVAEQLQRMGHEVTILCRPDSPLRHAACAARRVPGDLTDPVSLRAACASQDSVVHAAGLVGSERGWPAHREVDVLGTLHLTRAAIAAGVQRLVHVSSLIVHAAPRRGERIRETSPLRGGIPIWNPYARAKLMAERIVLHDCPPDRITTLVMRPGIVLGPRDRWTTPWLLRALERPAVTIVGRGTNRVPCVVVEELAETISRAATLPDPESGVYDLAGAATVTQRALYEHHARAVGRSVASFTIPTLLARATAGLLDALDPRGAASPLPPRRLAVEIASADGQVDCARAAAVLGWRGIAPWDDAVRRAVAWELRQHGDSYGWRPAGPRARHAERTTVAP